MNYSENFLKSECRSDFYISEKRKKIWLVLLEILAEIDSVCKKYNLRYFAANGTLLGAVRHNGFIPWDDDIDIMMPRDDYNKLIEISEIEFKHPLFLQVSSKEDDYYRNYMRIRNEDTTAISLIDICHRNCKGIFVDIFPLDGCDNTGIVHRLQYLKCKFLDSLLYNYIYCYDLENYRFIRKILHTVSDIFFGKFGIKAVILYLEGLRSEHCFDKSEYVQAITHGFDETIFNREVFEESILMDFEYTKIPVPKHYGKILNTIYGDYMKLPAAGNRGIHHNIFFDPECSYREYEGKLSKEILSDKRDDY